MELTDYPPFRVISGRITLRFNYLLSRYLNPILLLVVFLNMGDILLIYHGHKYIIETKINRSNLDMTIEKAIDQLCGKYLLTERANEGIRGNF